MTSEKTYHSIRSSVIILFILILFGNSLFAQGIDIRGVVTDSASTDRIPFTNVIIVGTNKGAASNMNGFYLITNVNPGRYEIAASAVGYEKKVIQIYAGFESPLVVNFKLKSKAVEFPEIVVTERSKRELAEISTSVHVLDQQEIRSVPVTVQDDVFRAIQILPGIVTTSDVNSHFYVRGGGGDQNLILLDGMKIYNPFHAFGVFSIFDPDIIRSTEVYTGAFPPGYGGRLSSVVNLSTRDGRRTGFAGKGNINFLSTKLQLEGPIYENIQILVSGRKLIFPQTLDRLLRREAPIDFYDGFIKLTRQTEEASNLSVQSFFSGDDLRSNNPAEPNYSWRTRNFGFTATGLIQDRIYVHTIGFQNDFEAWRDAKNSKSITPTSTRVSEIGLRAEATLYTDSRDLFFFGFEFTFPQMEYKLVNAFGVNRELKKSNVETWVWARYQANFGEFKIDGGVHVDVATLFTRGGGFENIQPRINLSHSLGESWIAKFSYGRFSQNVITVNNEDDVISVFDAWIPIPSELENEKADHIVFGVDGNLYRTFSTSFQGYYKSYGSLVTYNRDKVDALDPDYINSIGRSYGFEALLRYGSPLLDAYASYTLGWTSITSGGLTYPPRHDRRHTLNLLSVLHLLSNLDVSLRWEVGTGFPFSQTMGYYDRLRFSSIFDGRFAGETGTPYSILGEKNAARLPTFHRLDVTVSYKFSIGRLRGNVGGHIINLYNHENVFYFDRKTGRRINMLPFFPSISLNLEF